MLSLLKAFHLAEIGFPYFAELPAGLIDDGEMPEEAAIHELQEETGYKAESALELSAVGRSTVAWSRVRGRSARGLGL
jgi:8-oxo-dGTP pyrophosphatase MutT (NUDIX family)